MVRRVRIGCTTNIVRRNADGPLSDGSAIAFVCIEKFHGRPSADHRSQLQSDVALADAPDISEAWMDITSMARWEWVRWINATKNSQTRRRRVEVSISKLRKGMRRPCCFDLAACTDPELSRNGKLIEAV